MGMKGNTSKSKRGFQIVFSALFIIFFVFLDQRAKSLAALYLKGQSSRRLISNVLELRYLENNGAAFSMLEGKQGFLIVLTILFLLFGIFVLYRTKVSRRMMAFHLTILLLISGAVGNLIDRMLHGYVVDFIYFSLIDFPIFNFADIYVTISVIALIIEMVFIYKDEDWKDVKPSDEG